jgi:hypothetical protein
MTTSLVATASTSPSERSAANGNRILGTKLRSVLMNRTSDECFGDFNDDANVRMKKYPDIYGPWRNVVKDTISTFWKDWKESKKRVRLSLQVCLRKE